MKRAMIYLILGFAFLGLCVAPLAIADEDKEEAAVTAAQTWLTLIDEGKYSANWDAAAQYFKNAIAKEKWEQMLGAVRKPLGKLLFREPINRTYTQSLPGAPDGEYVVIQFKASFKNKESGVETVTPMLDGDGKWRVSGYYIK
jgi:predicted SnoaL-like aldol condensation-catalyzing enzyme